MSRDKLLKRVRKLVVKIGTASLSNTEGGLDESQVARLAEQLHALKQRGLQVTLVTSGAIGAGMNALGIRRRPTHVPDLQACAAIGQGHLISVYDQCFSRYGYHAAQMLLTRDDFNDRRRYMNASNAIHAILAYGSVPVINENDTISVEEIDLSFGDNDGLAALVTNLVSADLLVLLTEAEGLYENPDAPAAQRKIVREAPKVTDAIRQMATSSKSKGGRGGMVSKIEAARVATEAGGAVVIAGARTPNVLGRLFDGADVGTLFLPAKPERLGRHKCWLRYGTRPKGKLAVDSGARRALAQDGKSLLPSGIRAVDGAFDRGDLVAVTDEAGAEFARGLVNYSSDEMRKIMGQKTAAVHRILGNTLYDEAIHRDHLVLSE